MELNLKKNSLSWWRIVLIILVYFVGYVEFSSQVFEFVYAIFSNSINSFQLSYYLTLMIFLIPIVVLAWPLLEESYISLRKTEGFFRSVLIIFGTMYLTMMILSILMTLFNIGESSNQTSLNALADSFPVIFVFSSVIFAPIVEEIVFRGILYRELLPFIDKKYAAIISALLFGLIHIILALIDQNFSELVFLPIYGMMGYFFAKAYERNDTIFSAMLVHALWNLIASLIRIL